MVCVLFGGVMSHTELLRLFTVTAVWFTQRWLIVLLSAVTLKTPGRQTLQPLVPPFSPSSSQLSCLLLPLFFFLTNWCSVNGTHWNWDGASETGPRGWIKDCWRVSVRKTGLPWWFAIKLSQYQTATATVEVGCKEARSSIQSNISLWWPIDWSQCYFCVFDGVLF